jgi:hypothetical protein
MDKRRPQFLSHYVYMLRPVFHMLFIKLVSMITMRSELVRSCWHWLLRNKSYIRLITQREAQNKKHNK